MLIMAVGLEDTERDPGCAVQPGVRDMASVGLEDLRLEIDRVDDRIIDLVSQRLDIAKRVAACKMANGIPILDETREESVVSVFELEMAGRGMSPEAGRILARTLIDAAIAEERHLFGGAT